jgi:hypothetical protein
VPSNALGCADVVVGRVGCLSLVVSFWAGLVRRLVVSAKYRPKGGDMKYTHRHIGARVRPTSKQIDQRVQAAREHAMIRFVYGKRG